MSVIGKDVVKVEIDDKYRYEYLEDGSRRTIHIEDDEDRVVDPNEVKTYFKNGYIRTVKKDKQGRLLIPSDIWKMSRYCNFDGSLDLGFFVTTDLKVCITHISHAKKADLEFLCYCNLDFKRRRSKKAG